MCAFRPRRSNFDVELAPHDLKPNVHQMMLVLNHGEVYDLIPELRPLWWKAIRVACRINRLKTERRQDTAHLLWSLYRELYGAFIDRVREMHEKGESHKLVALKPLIRRYLRINPQWLVFHCGTDSGEILHVMV
jgi:hypothetical protein